jgi:hypothetical protein
MSIHAPAEVPQVVLRPMTLSWVLKRSAIGIAILTVAIGTMAWLTYASIDPQLDADSFGTVAPTVTKVDLRV